MKVLITGGQGYIGGHLVRSFLSDGWNVTILDSGFNSFLWEFGNSSNMYCIRAGVTKIDAVIRAMEGVDIVYHLAARTDWSNAFRHPMRLTSTNVHGTTTVLAMARRAGVNQVIFTSTADVYGNVVPADEASPCIPVTMYGCSKLAAENICRGFYNIGMDVTIVRLFNVWGRENSHSVVNKFATGVKTIKGNGHQTRDFIHVDDVILALRMASGWEPSIYNIGTGEETTISGLWGLINGDAVPIYTSLGHGELEIERSCADITTTAQRTGWEPRILMSSLDSELIRKYCMPLGEEFK